MVIVSPYVWAASLDGRASLAGLNGTVDVPFSDVFQQLDFAVMGNIEITNGLWGVSLDGQHVNTSEDETVIGNRVRIRTNMTVLSAGVFYRLHEQALGGTTVVGEPRRFAIEPLIGVRWTDLTADVTALGRRGSANANWTDPFIGLRVQADLTERWNLSTEADLGGFGVGTRLSLHAQAYLGYRTTMLGRPAMLRAGYRVLHQDYAGDDFTGRDRFRWKVTQHGPVVGFSLRF